MKTNKQFKYKTIMTIIIIVLFNFNCYTQNNLVPNYSFENYSSCPPLGTSISYAVPWFQPNSSGGSNGSSDFYHTCTCPTFGCPPNSGGFQYPKTGNGFVGIAMFFDSTINNIDKWREYIEVGLIDSLIAGKKYCIRYYTVKGNWSSYAVKNIQAVLTNDSLLYNDPNYGYIQGVTPIIEAGSIVTDTLNWLPIQTTYTAHGGERFLTIGNFSSGANTVYQYVWPYNGTPNSLGYYLIDDVSIYEQPEVFAGNDTLIQVGDSVQIGITGRPDVFYSWSPATGLSNPNIANPIAHPLVSTLYILSVTDTNDLACTIKFYDTVRVWVGTVGVIENTVSDNFVKLYPNPSQNIVYYEAQLSDNESGILLIYDVLGNQVLAQQLNAGYNKQNIDVSKLSNGLYLYCIYINGEFKEKNKFIIQR